MALLIGFGLATLGVFGDYSGNDQVGNLGFGFELIGFIVVAIGSFMLGISLWREENRPLAGIAVGLVGPMSLTAGSALVGHIPSGTASLLMIAGLAIAAFGLWSSQPGHE